MGQVAPVAPPVGPGVVGRGEGGEARAVGREGLDGLPDLRAHYKVIVGVAPAGGGLAGAPPGPAVVGGHARAQWGLVGQLQGGLFANLGQVPQTGL